jgi:MoaA/NifB/PqqE/SkfB family radical SAM enzyme
LLSGQQHPDCQKCWDIESSGQISRRQQENTFLDYKLDRDLEKIQQDCIDKQSTTLLYQITTSNLCNQACVTCNSSYSTKWQELDRQMNIAQKSQPSIDDFSKQIDYANAKRIEILGGEPLFDPVALRLLDQLITNNNRDCFISLVTNGSITLKPTQIGKFKQLNDLNICVSIDGIGSVFEYMRWPGKWNNLLENIEQYRSIAKTITVSYTISAVNALYHDQTVEWFNKNNLSYNYVIVSYPKWASLNHMPVQLKQILSQKNNFVSNFCKIDGNEISMSVLAEQISQQDQAKRISIRDYMPEMADIIFDTL